MKTYKISQVLLLIGVILSLSITSCRDEFNQEQALESQKAANDSTLTLIADLEKRNQEDLELLRDSLLRAGGVIVYTVQVLDATTSSFFSRTKAGITGATVTGIQNGAVATATDAGNGLYVFDDMRIGEVAVNVQATGFTEVNYIADITPNDEDFGAFEQQPQQPRNAASQIGLFNTSAATVTGTLQGEVDVTNGVLENLASQTVFARLDSVPEIYWSTLLSISDTDGNDISICDCGAGRILEIAYDANTSATTDAAGLYTIPIPASANGDLAISIATNEIITDRVAFEFDSPSNGRLSQVSTTTIWGSDITNDIVLSNQSTDVLDGFGSSVQVLNATDGEFTNVAITTSTPVAGSGAAITALLDDAGTPGVPGDDFVTLNLTAGGSGYRLSGNVELRFSGGGGPTQDINLETFDASAPNFINIVTDATTGRIEDFANPNSYPVVNFTSPLFVGQYTSAPTVQVIDIDDKFPAEIYAVANSGGDITALNVIYGGAGYFNSGDPITSIIDPLTGSASALTVALNGFTTFNGALPGGTTTYIITGGSTGFVTGNDFGGVAQATWGTAAITGGSLNPEPGRTYTYNIYLGIGQEINTFGI